MKVLKRPMFKYGGDVRKQGIMHGMNGLRNGGIATTMADALGMANGGMIRQGYNKGLSVAPLPNFYENEMSISPQKVPFYQTMSSSRYKKPDSSPTNIKDYYKEKGEKMKKTGETIADFVIAKPIEGGKTYRGYTVPDYKPTKPTSTMIMKQEEMADVDYPGITEPRKTTMDIKQEELSGAKIKTPILSQKDTDAKRLERAYKILGVDDAKKDAVYNALIDLSQGQGIDTKDISGSINRAIGALSKRADKVTDLKDKAKAALASGTLQAELTKEINKEKGTPYDEKEKYFKGKLGDVKGERAAVGSPISVFAALSKTKPGDSKSTRTEQAVTEYFDGIGGVPVYKGPLPGLELETINVGEKTETEDGAYRIGTGYIVVEKGIITEKKNLFPKK